MAKAPKNPDASKRQRDDDQDYGVDAPVKTDVKPGRTKRSAFSSQGSGSPYRQAKVRNPYSARYGGMRVG